MSQEAIDLTASYFVRTSCLLFSMLKSLVTYNFFFNAVHITNNKAVHMLDILLCIRRTRTKE